MNKLLPLLLLWCSSLVAQDGIGIIIKGEPNTGYAIVNGQLHRLGTVIMVGGDTDPEPPPPLPTGTLQEFARSLAQSSGLPRAEIGKVRDNLVRVAEEIEKLRDPTNTDLDILTPADATLALNGANRQSLGSSYSKWKPYLEKVADELDRRVGEGDIKNHVYSVGEAYSRLAEGLAPLAGDRLRAACPAESLGKFLPPVINQPDDMEAEKRLQDLYGYGREDAPRAIGLPAVHLDQVGQPEWLRESARDGEAIFAEETVGNKFPERFRGEGKGRRAVWWNYALRHDGRDGMKRFGISQITGNCVAASSGDVGVTHMLGAAYYLHGREIKPGEVGSVAHYQFRGHCGQGANLGTLGTALERYGYPLRIDYLQGKYDLRDTDADQRFGMNHCRSQPGDFWDEVKPYKLGRFATFGGNANDAMDILYSGGTLWCGGTRTWSGNGNPICSNTRVGPHAQTCIGYDDTDECRQLLGISEPVFFFDQTWGGSETSYIKSGWREELWGKRTRGHGMLRWSDCHGLLYNATTFAFWPDLSGTNPEDLDWRQ